jgi:hypothetical protein
MWSWIRRAETRAGVRAAAAVRQHRATGRERLLHRHLRRVAALLAQAQEEMAALRSRFWRREKRRLRE